jgi:polyisoprenoid-binding protein YceI
MTAAIETTQLSTGTWAIDPVHSSIEFAVRHSIVSKVRGRFDQPKRREIEALTQQP